MLVVDAEHVGHGQPLFDARERDRGVGALVVPAEDLLPVARVELVHRLLHAARLRRRPDSRPRLCVEVRAVGAEPDALLHVVEPDDELGAHDRLHPAR